MARVWTPDRRIWIPDSLRALRVPMPWRDVGVMRCPRCRRERCRECGRPLALRRPPRLERGGVLPARWTPWLELFTLGKKQRNPGGKCQRKGGRAVRSGETNAKCCCADTTMYTEAYTCADDEPTDQWAVVGALMGDNTPVVPGGVFKDTGDDTCYYWNDQRSQLSGPLVDLTNFESIDTCELCEAVEIECCLAFGCCFSNASQALVSSAMHLECTFDDTGCAGDVTTRSGRRANGGNQMTLAYVACGVYQATYGIDFPQVDGLDPGTCQSWRNNLENRLWTAQWTGVWGVVSTPADFNQVTDTANTCAGGTKSISDCTDLDPISASFETELAVVIVGNDGCCYDAGPPEACTVC